MINDTMAVREHMMQTGASRWLSAQMVRLPFPVITAAISTAT